LAPAPPAPRRFVCGVRRRGRVICRRRR
jgi:hypothetical protein